MKVYGKVTELIGSTPLLRLAGMEKKLGVSDGTQLIAKLESFNPAGSAKDRVG